MRPYHLFSSDLCITEGYFFRGHHLPATDMVGPYRLVKNYEIEYFIRGGGGIVVNQNALPFPTGSVNLRKPGQRVCGIAPYDCSVIHLEPTQELDRLLLDLPDRLFPQSSAQVENLMERIIVSLPLKDPASRLKTTADVYALLEEILSAVPEQVSLRHRYHPEVKRAVQYVCANLDKPIDIAKLAVQSGLSKSHFHKIFRECTGTTPKQFVTALKMDRCKQLLCYTGQSIGEIASSVGIYDNVYFSYVFKRSTGMTPTDYRRKHGFQS